MGSAARLLSDVTRRLEQMRSVGMELAQEPDDLIWLDSVPNDSRESIMMNQADIQFGFSEYLQPIIISNIEHARFYRTKAELLLQVASITNFLFNLIAHAQARASQNVAKASNRAADDTRKEGENMKTIAIVTTCFLPATFFAVLFRSFL